MNRIMSGKKGITLVALAITIVIIAILLSVTIVTAVESMNNAAISAFLNDLTTVTNEVKKDYYQNGEFATLNENGTAISQKSVVKLVPDRAKSNFIKELKLNGDFVEDDNFGAYYLIDLPKLGFKSINKGLQTDGESDVFVVSYPSMMVYYLKGFEDYYFSLSPEVSQISKIPTPESPDITDTYVDGGITVKKDKKLWTNQLGISITANIESGEKLYLEINNVQKEITTTIGLNKFYLNRFEEIVDNKLAMKVPALTASDVRIFNNTAQDSKIFKLVKKKGSTVVSTIVIPLANYEVGKPVKETDVTRKTVDGNNVITFKATDALSGMKEVRYEYLKLYRNDGVEDYYKNITSYDASYLMTRGKKAVLNADGEYEITYPTEVQSLQILLVDKAGNTETFNFDYDGGINMSFTEIANSVSKVSYEIKYKSPYGIKNVEISTSSDGVNYSSPKSYAYNTKLSEFTKSYEENIDGVNKLYIKVTATDYNSDYLSIISKTKIFTVNAQGGKTFSYTGAPQTFTADKTGTYRIELWGAKGGDISTFKGGNGAYTKGEIKLVAGTKLYVYVGGQGGTSFSGGWNGGGMISSTSSAWGNSGGGATDIRTSGGNWNDVQGLRNRIMVAAGGGAANDRNAANTYHSGAATTEFPFGPGEYRYGAGNGGAGGELVGENGQSVNFTGNGTTTFTYLTHGNTYGATQTSGGVIKSIYSQTGAEKSSTIDGKFGMTSLNAKQTGGGSGYYGGSGGAHGGASGGSSYISGHTGCNSVNADGIHTGSAKHFSGYSFTNTVMIAGSKSMPTLSGVGTTIGNAGNGFARITYLGN